MIGSRIGGRYEIIKIIGDGGMSRVYLAHDIILNRDVAIKVLNYDFANEEELKRRFQREALSATSLTHPHIVDIFDVGEEGKLHYLVMEYIEGQTLKKFIKTNGPLKPERALPIMRQLVSAISNAHHNGIVHRDIKPQNILMDPDGNVKITDFGIAMALSASDHTKTNSVIGTVHYLSPEQARGGMATKKSDIYSLGIVLYELLTGELPFSAESAVAIALKHLQEETPSVRALFPTIPQSVENVILKATAKDATYRYRSADEMVDDLLTVLSLERANEEKLSIPFDDDRTRSIPVVNEMSKFTSIESTKKIEPVTLEQPPVAVKKRKKWPIIAGSIGGIIILLLLLFISGILGPKQVEIPKVEGMEETKAVNLLEEKGFKADERMEQPSDEFEKGIVISTVPEVGKKRDKGTSVKLFVSTGKETMELEDYTGRDYTQIYSLLASYGFKVDSEEEFNDEPTGTILKQNHEKGSELIPSETDILFTVSKGPDEQELESLENYDKDRLHDYEKTSGFKIIVVGEKHSATIEAGHVLSQRPSARTKIAKGGKVEVVMSKGVEKKPVKSIFKTVTIEYKPEVMDAYEDEEGNWIEPELVPQQIRIYVQDKTHTMADPVEEFTITENTVKQIKIELEEGQRGAYKITRDSTIIAEEPVQLQ
ncbi:Stk1 family PASTA domain-containing Ser/Thr kinase [Sporosarcina limicola]|uniref:Serine/threonine-protein kinase PrkC n=1 Tax=Sporosarcina limicola TaxID=34101 RepID=A0A927MFH8_9BACL|nr:Stk1 family PASTA domain-containing Ser/Thr kinase [Sporosarcina limicola]MBE1553510.1 serine/threonine-protein kinase [Sporosarcina limicola]